MTIQSLYTLAVLTLGAILCIPESSHAFVASSRPIRQPSFSVAAASDDNDVLAAAIDAMYGSGSEMREEVSSFCGNDDGLICPRHLRRVNLLLNSLSRYSVSFASHHLQPAITQERIETLVNENSVLLFMKGAKSFPQCGFSDTATKILETLNVDFHTIDVLEDEAIREGIKVYSQWPTIPQLYVNGEFIGGSDIMLEMYEDGSLKELLNG